MFQEVLCKNQVSPKSMSVRSFFVLLQHGMTHVARLINTVMAFNFYKSETELCKTTLYTLQDIIMQDPTWLPLGSETVVYTLYQLVFCACYVSYSYMLYKLSPSSHTPLAPLGLLKCHAVKQACYFINCVLSHPWLLWLLLRIQV